MNRDGFEAFVNAAFCLCAGMAVISLVRWKKYGPKALFLSGAFVAMGGALWFIGQGVMGWQTYVCAGLLAVLLGADMLSRSPS